MMKKLLPMILASLLAYASPMVVAAPDGAPPVHEQKNHVPDSTANGNYLEDQPDNNGATGSTTQGNQRSDQKRSKASNIEKSKKVKEKPADGGVNVNQSQ